MNTPKITIEIEKPIRLRVRRVNENSIVAEAIAAAKEKGRPVIFARHGGSVANKYGYPAETEGAVCIAWPDGSARVSIVRLPANKVSLSGVFHAVTGFRGLFDDRFSNSKKAEVRKEFLEIHEREIMLAA